MIKILGGFVKFNGERKFAGDVFSSTQEHEAALVREGFAEYVNEPKKAEKKDELRNGEDGKQTEDNNVEFDEAKAARLNVDKLKELAISHNVDEKDLLNEDGNNKTKKEIIELIKAALENSKAEDVGNGDDNFNELGNGEDGIA